MIIFNEEKYAKEIINNSKFKTNKNRGYERCVLVRYLFAEGYTEDGIKDYLNGLSRGEFPYLSKNDKYKIFDKIIAKANQYEYIKDRNVKIYKSELEIINSIENEKARDLLFICLVYYKWGCTVDAFKFYSKNMNKILVEEKDKDLYYMSKLNSLRVKDRNLTFYELIKNRLYVNCGFKDKNYFYIPFACSDGEVAFEIDNFNDLILWLYSYLEPEKYKKCEICERWIKKTKSPKKYCSECANSMVRKHKRHYINKTRKNVDKTKID